MTALFGSITFDQTPVVTTTLDDLDLQAVAQHLDYARTQGRYRGEAIDPIDFLIEQRAVVEIESAVIPTVAGILFFGKQPQRHLPYATIKLARYRGQEINANEVQHIDEYSGSVRQQIDRVVTYLNDHVERGYALDGGPQRVEQPQYPPTALRELTVNAVAHRDYTIMASSIRIAMFQNRIEWASPGSLPSSVTPENILDMQFARNPLLAQLLYQSGYVEAYGQGLDTVFNILQAQNLPLPTMRESGATFVIGIEGHQPIGLDAEQLSSLTDAEYQIVAVVRARRSATTQDIIDALAARSERSVQYDLKRLVERGVLQRVGKGRATTYILPRT
ncbi:MAG TPA: ATP-binding protein [Herpetosiphonaceae bacterium]